MIEFVVLSPISRESYKGLPRKPCIFTKHIPKGLEENFVSHSKGSTEHFGMNLKGHRSAG